MEVKARKYLKNAAFALLVLIIIIPILFPLYFVFISSFKIWRRYTLCRRNCLVLSL